MLGRIVTLAAVAAGGVMLSKKLRKNGESGKKTSVIEDSVEVNVPVSTAYNQWTQFEEFPKFMKGVNEVRQLDDTHLYWRAEIGGKEEEWDAEITEQVPDTRIAWRSTSGIKNDGVVSFFEISDSVTRVVVKMEYGPKGFIEEIGDALGIVKLRTTGDLKRFKEFLENRGGKETGAWRGSVGQH
ncbi:MAG: SRPBCC family protein [Nitrosospira sp.]|nr:SRPBCC family protein [Nitrosospira sp.]